MARKGRAPTTWNDRSHEWNGCAARWSAWLETDKRIRTANRNRADNSKVVNSRVVNSREANRQAANNRAVVNKVAANRGAANREAASAAAGSQAVHRATKPMDLAAGRPGNTVPVYNTAGICPKAFTMLRWIVRSIQMKPFVMPHGI